MGAVQTNTGASSVRTSLLKTSKHKTLRMKCDRWNSAYVNRLLRTSPRKHSRSTRVGHGLYEGYPPVRKTASSDPRTDTMFAQRLRKTSFPWLKCHTLRSLSPRRGIRSVRPSCCRNLCVPSTVLRPKIAASCFKKQVEALTNSRFTAISETSQSTTYVYVHLSTQSHLVHQ